ncbi:DUF4405 domain-containing protein [uncultured Paludibaculum sp.]|uniref:DUF4405 domain-containing protein n=1 Tax=uncultured Paludibaculum sp. TaxID=1765020 RepID=UPI002AAC4B19|nr:DUF4405 domain-containing protein [uncultured Paludibaculum sp.]
MTLVGRRLPIRSRLNSSTNLLALAAAVLTFSTGLVLLTHFHVGEGSLRAWALGQSRLVWVNLHRFSALAFLAAIAVHGQLHWRPLAAQVGRVFGRRPGKVSRADLVLYVGFAIVSAAGLAAWFGAPGSLPLFGPATLDRLGPQRHFWLDLHNVSGLIVLPAMVIHVRHRFRSILRAIGWPERRDGHGSKQPNL